MSHTCSRCGTNVPSDRDVCPNCGVVVTRPDNTIRCNHCHRSAPSQLTLCPHCGRELHAWRPYRPIAAVVLLLILFGLLNFAGGWDLISRAGQAVTALIPPPATLLPGPTQTPIPTLTTSPTEIVVVIQPTPTPIVLTATSMPAIEPAEIATDTPVSTPTPTEEAVPTTYIVEPGDTLIGIAGQLDTTVEALMSFNNIKDATSLRVNQEIKIPPPEPTATPIPSETPTAEPTATQTPTAEASPTRTPRGTRQATAQTATTPTSTSEPIATDTPEPTVTPTSKPAGPSTYIVQRGDTLVGIATQVDRSVEAIAVYNKIKDPTALRINQELKIPPAKYTPPPPTTKPPTVTPTPIATPTPSISLPAPLLVNPGDGSPYNGGKNELIVLAWQNPTGLPTGIENRVHIGVIVGENLVDWRLEEAIGQATEFIVPAWLFGQAPQEYGRGYVWYIQAVSTTRTGDEPAASSPVSIPSEQRRFYWNKS